MRLANDHITIEQATGCLNQTGRSKFNQTRNKCVSGIIVTACTSPDLLCALARWGCSLSGDINQL